MDLRFHHGYVSIAALIVHPEKERFLMATRDDDADFQPGGVMLPSRRIYEGQHVSDGLADVMYEQTGLEWGLHQYLGSHVFNRPDAPVLQLCFGVDALNDKLKPHEKRLHDYRWLTYEEFMDECWQEERNEYYNQLQHTVFTASSRGLLRNTRH
jgi:hypothetical protein